MAFDILGALRRAFTLPKAANSLSDVLGKDIADAISATVHARIADAVTQGALEVAKLAVKTEEHAAQLISGYVIHALEKVSPLLGGQVQAAVNAGLGNVEALTVTTVGTFAQKIVDEVAKVLKI
jgi:hypothetical protein